MDANTKNRSAISKVASDRVLLYLPGVNDRRAFLQRCTGDLKCAAACPYGSITKVQTEQDLVMPFINPSESPCRLCFPSPCAEACTSGALQQIPPQDVRMGTAQLDPYHCLCFQGRECKVCYEACPLKGTAIFWDKDVLAPLINMDKCTGCGICMHQCPAPERPIKIIGT